MVSDGEVAIGEWLNLFSLNFNVFNSTRTLVLKEKICLIFGVSRIIRTENYLNFDDIVELSSLKGDFQLLVPFSD